MAYIISSDAGKKKAQNMKVGETVTVSDGSTWEKKADGSVSVTTSKGERFDNAYTPTSSGGGSNYSPPTTTNYTQGNYKIGSVNGQKKAQDMAVNSSWTATDGSIWTKEKDGSITVRHNGTETKNAYQTDLGTLGLTQMNARLPWQVVEDTLNARVGRATETPGLEQYAYDDTYLALWNYIQNEKAKETKTNAINDFTAWGQNYNQANPMPTYESKYNPEIEKRLNEILTREDFSYDAENDPLYQMYSEMYKREGDRAMRDTLAEAAAGAGGMNSYAITAAQQANNYYNSQLTDMIPQLYQLAYDMYLNEKESMVQDLGLLQDMDNTQYNRYRDTMSDWRDDKDFAYGVYKDAVDQGNLETNFNYNAAVGDRNFMNDNFWATQDWKAQQEQTALDNSYREKEWSEAEIEQAKKDVWELVDRRVMPDAELIEKSGINPESVRTAYNNVIGEENKTKSSGGGGGNPVYKPIEEPGTDPTGDEITSTTSTSGSLLSTPLIPVHEGAKTFATVESDCKEILKNYGKEAALAYLNEVKETGAIDQVSYTILWNRYKNKE